jgi:hypothetical protein
MDEATKKKIADHPKVKAEVARLKIAAQERKLAAMDDSGELPDIM